MRTHIMLDHYLYEGYPDIKVAPYSEIFMHETRVVYIFPNERPQFLLFRLSLREDLETLRFSFYLDNQERYESLNKNPPRRSMLRYRNSMYEKYSRDWDREHGKVVVANYEDTDGMIIDPKQVGVELTCFKEHLAFLTLVEITCYVIERNNRMIDNIFIERKERYYHEILAIFMDTCQHAKNFTPVHVKKSLSELILMNDAILSPSHAKVLATKISDISEEDTLGVEDSKTFLTSIKLDGLKFSAELPVSMRVDFYNTTAIVRFRIHFGEKFGELKSYCGVMFEIIELEDETENFDFHSMLLTTLKNFSERFLTWFYDDFNVNGYKESLDMFEILRRSIPYNANIVTNR